jgi:cytochrome c551/c552
MWGRSLYSWRLLFVRFSSDRIMTVKRVVLAAILASSFCADTWAQEPVGQPAVREQGQLIFGAMCSACHLPDRMHVGPSLVEIAKLYRGKPAEFRAWCKDPQPKRKGVIQMPSMAALSDDVLASIYEYILHATMGVKEVVEKNADKFRASPSMRKRPLIQRVFMPESGPASIAVAVNERFHYCFDAGACRLRYVWAGDFIDGWPVWRSNGNGLAEILGDVLLREAKSPLPVTSDMERKFLGYRVRDGLPTFLYRVGVVNVQERISLAEDGQGLIRRFVLRGDVDDWRMSFVGSKHIVYRSSDGAFDGATFVPKNGKSRDFTVTMREEK